MKLIKKFTYIVATFAFMLQFAAVFAPAGVSLLGNNVVASADHTAEHSACEGASLLDSSANCDDPTASENRLSSVLSTGLNLFSMVVGVISVVMIIIGGVRYITSQGEASNTKAAKDTIIYAIIGLIVVLLAQVIVQFVLGSV